MVSDGKTRGFPWDLHTRWAKVKLAVSAGALATSDDGAWVWLANKAWVGGV